MQAVDFTLREALYFWWSGGSLSGSSIHGVQILWVGRAGKVLQYIGALTILIDIIGPRKLVAIGISLRRIKLNALARREIDTSIKYVTDTFQLLFHSKNQMEAKRRSARESNYFIYDIITATALGISSAAMLSSDALRGVPLAVALTLFFYGIVSPFATALITILFGLASVIVGATILPLVVKFFTSPTGEQYAKAIGLSIGTLGFLLDLSTS